MRLLAGWLYAIGIVATLGGAIVWLVNIPDLPDEEDLVWKKGFVIGILLDRDYDGLDIVNLRFRDDEKLYTFHSIYPSYVEVRDRLGIYREVEVRVERASLLTQGDTAAIWGLIEHDPFHEEGTVVTFDEIREEVTETERSWQGVAIIFLVAGIAAILTGYAIRRWVPHMPRDPVA